MTKKGEFMLNDAIHDAMVGYLKCYDIRTACQLSGISNGTYYKWRTKGKQDYKANDMTQEARFWLATEESRAHYKSPVIGALRDKAARGDVQASKTILASSDKETWGDNIRLEQEIEKVIKKLAQGLDADTLERVMDILDD